MCQPCDAAQERLDAAVALRRACVAKYGTWDTEGLRGLYPVKPLPDSFAALLDKLDRQQG